MKALILTAKFGMGHYSAAQSLKADWEKSFPGSQAVVKDILSCAMPSFSQKIYQSFELLVRRGSKLYSTFYKFSSHAEKQLNIARYPMGDFLVQCAKRLIRAEKPDVIISTIPVASDIITAYKEKTGDTITLVTCITDISVHPEWVKWAAGMLKCPVVANGNIVDAATAEAWVRLARPAGLMIGRAALRNPWIFSQLHSRFQGHPAADLTFRNVLHYIRRLYERTREMQEHYVEEKHIHRMKKYLVYTARGLPDTFDHYMKRAKTARDFMRICEDILDNDAPFAPTPPEDTHLFAHFHTLLAQEEACLPPGIQV